MTAEVLNTHAKALPIICLRCGQTLNRVRIAIGSNLPEKVLEVCDDCMTAADHQLHGHPEVDSLA
jgi:NMD protein affecting ribosome stability and mRNA decay